MGTKLKWIIELFINLTLSLRITLSFILTQCRVLFCMVEYSNVRLRNVQKILLLLVFCTLFLPIVSAVRNTADIEVPYNITINISNNIVIAYFNNEVILTHNLLSNSSGMQSQVSGIYETTIDNRIYLRTTECNTSLLINELTNLTGQIQTHMNSKELELETALEPLTSLQGRLDTKQRDLDSCNDKIRLQGSSINNTKLQLSYAIEKQSDAETLQWILSGIVIVLIVFVAIMFKKVFLL